MAGHLLPHAVIPAVGHARHHTHNLGTQFALTRATEREEEARNISEEEARDASEAAVEPLRPQEAVGGTCRVTQDFCSTPTALLWRPWTRPGKTLPNSG